MVLPIAGIRSTDCPEYLPVAFWNFKGFLPASPKGLDTLHWDKVNSFEVAACRW